MAIPRAHVLRVAFDDGQVTEVEYQLGTAKPDGVFGPLEHPSYFASAFVAEESGTVTWPNSLDLAPEVLHGDHPFPAQSPFQVVAIEGWREAH